MMSRNVTYLRGNHLITSKDVTYLIFHGNHLITNRDVTYLHRNQMIMKCYRHRIEQYLNTMDKVFSFYNDDNKEITRNSYMEKEQSTENLFGVFSM